MSSSLSPSAPHAIELRNVSQLFGSFVALRNISLSLPTGSSVVLRGENGAGKSTLLRLLAGFAAPAKGEVRVLGMNPRDMRGSIAYMGHASMLYDELTAFENLTYFYRLTAPKTQRDALANRCADALREVDLDPSNPRRLSEYSQGMRQRASLARVLLSEPDLLLLDEPFSNLDSDSARKMILRLQQFVARPSGNAPDDKARPRTLVLTTHQTELARPLAEITLTLSAGQLVSTERGAATSPRPVGLGASINGART